MGWFEGRHDDGVDEGVIVNKETKEFNINCSCGCGGVLIHWLEFERLDGASLATLSMHSGRGVAGPFSFWEKIRNAWRYLCVYNSSVYCDDIVLHREGVIELRDACDSVLELFEESQMDDLFDNNKTLEKIYDEMRENGKIDATITADELVEALRVIRIEKTSKKENCDD